MMTVKNQKCKNKGDPFCAFHSNIFHERMLQSVYDAMASYISSPWNSATQQIMSEVEYKKILSRFLESNIEDPQRLCFSTYEPGSELANYKIQLCQSHAGNLFEHSQWAALYILRWYSKNVDIMEGVDFLVAYVSAFFHDIGKGGDCIETTKIIDGKRVSWRDMYSPDKYAKKGEQLHPEYSGDMILGKRVFNFDCKNPEDIINFNTVIKMLFPEINMYEVALGAYMHWEFGKLNIGGALLEDKLRSYYTIFYDCCKKCGLKPSIRLLKLCIAVACADIAAGTNSRLGSSVCGIVPKDTIYMGKDPWTMFGMDKKYKLYRDALIANFPF